MLSLAKSPLAPVLGRRVPLRGPARLLFSSYSRTRYKPGAHVVRLTTAAGDVFDADLSSTLEWQLWAFGSYESHLAELFGYTSELRNFTSGTASFSMEPSHYAPVKEELADIDLKAAS